MNISLRAPEKGPKKAKNGVLTMKKIFEGPKLVIFFHWDEKWVSMQKTRNFGSKTAEIAPASPGRSKCLSPLLNCLGAFFVAASPLKKFEPVTREPVDT